MSKSMKGNHTPESLTKFRRKVFSLMERLAKDSDWHLPGLRVIEVVDQICQAHEEELSFYKRALATYESIGKVIKRMEA